jgi:CHAT domain-containing protein
VAGEREANPQSDTLLLNQYEIVNLPSASTLAVVRRETANRPSATKSLAVLADPVFEANDPRLLKLVQNKTAGDVATSTKSAVRAASEPQALPASDFGLGRAIRSFDVSGGRSGFSRLPFSREEADAIAALVPADSLLQAMDFRANRTTAASGELSRYRIVHFATHGLLNGTHPELSGLVLSLVDENGKPQDGYLRTHEIFNLQLPADVIVLSACQTALGKEVRGEGVVGLTRAFMYAGAQRVTASLWQVDELATAELMKLFYRGMLKDRLRPAAALRAAQVEMAKQKRWASPYFWAAFVMQGEWK